MISTDRFNGIRKKVVRVKSMITKKKKEEAVVDVNENGISSSTSLPSLILPFVPPVDKLEQLSIFLNLVEGIRKKIDDVNEDIDLMKKKQSQILTHPNPKEVMKTNLDDLYERIQEEFKDIRKSIKEIEDNVRLGEDASEKTGYFPATLRIKGSQGKALRKSFIDAMMEFRRSHTDFIKASRLRIIRQFEICGKEYTDEEVDSMVKEGNWAIFYAGIIAEPEQAKEMLVSIEDRHEEIVQLENSLSALHDLFVDMAYVIEDHEDIVNYLEENMKTFSRVKKVEGRPSISSEGGVEFGELETDLYSLGSLQIQPTREDKVEEIAQECIEEKEISITKL